MKGYDTPANIVVKVEKINRASLVKEKRKELYISLLSQLEAKGGFVTFQDQEKENSWVQVLFSDDETHINFAYPYDENPNQIITKKDISFPADYALSEWAKKTSATFSGPRCPHSKLAYTINALFTKLSGASPNYVIEGRIE